MAKPVIGITTYAEEASWGAWSVPAALLPLAYVTKVESAGGRPLLVPPSEDGIEETLDVLDGIVFSGGSDLEPSMYGAEPHDATNNTRPHRDSAELRLMQAALDRDLPVLAICRGFEIMNVARGGSIEQHLPDVVGDDKHREVVGVFSEHAVRVEGGTKLAEILGEHTDVKSHHHQGVQHIGEGLIETAWADDGTVEGLEDPSRRFAVGVLWHPEEGSDAALFEALVAEAERYRAARSGS